ncbi:hypothetical protein ACFP3Q_07955 [Nocardioides sp. GCM10027113]|uniref:hypothetical protein n=1 Tax=unclassified Nocardioides TaxID=2615069 RepID=UPI00361DC412
MNSSGMKRGLATVAVSALAVTGLPFLATSASAASGDTMSMHSHGPVRDGNSAGGSVIVKSSSDQIDPAKIWVTKADYSGAKKMGAGKEITSPAFDVDVISFTLLDGDKDAAGVNKFADGFYHYEAITAVTLGTASKATFGLVEDADGNDAVNASDPKTVVEVTPTGAPASVSVSPSSQTTATGEQSPAYTVEVKDAAGNLTQVAPGEAFNVTSSGDAVATGALDDKTLNDGKATFTATAPTGGTKPLTVAGNGTGATKSTLMAGASLNVLERATITEDEFDLASGADTWSKDSKFGDPVQVRVDQDSITFNFASKDGADEGTAPDDANKAILLTLNSATLKFDGLNTKTYSVVLDDDGKGSLTVKPSGIVEDRAFTFASAGSGIPSTTVTFKRATASSVKSDAAAYVTKVGSPTDVVVTVKDQFGNAIGAPAQVQIVRGVRNGATTTARTTVNSAGQATITLPDAGTIPGVETFTVNLFDDQFDATPTNSEGGTINYTTDGRGADYVITGATSDAAATTMTPLYDAKAGAGDSTTINIAGGTPKVPAKVTVDNGALVLSGDDTTLDKGVASKSISLSDAGTGSFKVVGTKFGVTTVTIESAGRTKTVKLTVKAPTAAADVIKSARNVELEGPKKANAGEVATFTATVTDAFGNVVPGVPAGSLQFQVTGPANAQSADSVTDEAGEFEYGVLLTDNAKSTVSVKVTGVSNGGVTPQFGKAVNTYTDKNDAPGLTASENVATASIENVVNLTELEEAVKAAEAKVEAAQDALAEAQADLSVAEAELRVARSEVKAAKADLRQAKRKGEGIRAAKRALREARGDRAIAKASVAAEQLVVDNRMERLAKAEAELAEAKKKLDEAKNS